MSILALKSNHKIESGQGVPWPSLAGTVVVVRNKNGIAFLISLSSGPEEIVLIHMLWNCYEYDERLTKISIGDVAILCESQDSRERMQGCRFVRQSTKN